MTQGEKNKITIDNTIGKIFGRLTVIEFNGRNKHNNLLFLCKCSCGKIISVMGCKLRDGNTKSCGCLNKYIVKKVNSKHGDSFSVEYKTWCRMKNRCYNKNNPKYKYYGGRGITVCDRWLNSYENFLEDMGRKTTTKHTLDRINVNGNYEPSNCKWSTWKEQANNKRPFSKEALKNISKGQSNRYLREDEHVKTSESMSGEKNGSTKLTESYVRLLRFIVKYGKIEKGYCTKVAKELNVSYATIQNIIKNKSWKHIQV